LKWNRELDYFVELLGIILEILLFCQNASSKKFKVSMTLRKACHESYYHIYHSRDDKRDTSYMLHYSKI
jgi:hypothetical protein